MPAPPTNKVTPHFVYLVLEQKSYIKDWSSVKALGKMAFPTKKVIKDFDLKLVSSNFFTVNLGDEAPPAWAT